MKLDNSELMEQLRRANISLAGRVENKMVFEPFWNDFMMRFCWSSNAIEGNTLSLDETMDVLLYDEVRAGHTYSEYTEAKNLYSSIRTQMAYRKVDIDEEWIKKCNSLILGVDSDYRDRDVYIGTIMEATYYPPRFTEVPRLMRNLMSEGDIRTGDIEEIVSDIAEFHIKFERIHPFFDGNGRTGRMILNQQLINNDLLPITINKNSKYRQAFASYERSKDLSLLIYLICKNELEALKRLNAFEKKYNEVVGNAE
ncbi:MAG: Fic family protein [Lachnospiraceae bacterium]|nr:Fic family protein [Lachnospiraceae bacterium]